MGLYVQEPLSPGREGLESGLSDTSSQAEGRAIAQQ